MGKPKMPLTGGIAGSASEVTEDESDWTPRIALAQGLCFRCRRQAPRKTLAKQTTTDGHSLCRHCWDRTPAHKRRVPTKSKHKPQPVPSDPHAADRENRQILRENAHASREAARKRAKRKRWKENRKARDRAERGRAQVQRMTRIEQQLAALRGEPDA